MVSTVSDTESACRLLELIISLVRENIFMSWKVIIWVILYINYFHGFALLTNWIVLLKINLRITIMLISKMIYEGTLVSFLRVNYLWLNDLQIIW